jgi:putative membrane protein
MRTTKEYLLLFLKGAGMGGADVVPGVSGGTIAFITGIYEELITAIKSIDLDFFKLVKSFELKKAWKHINGNFLVTLVAGIGLSIISLARLITFLMETHPIPLWSFFFGLIIISAILVLKEASKPGIGLAIALVAGIGLALWITMSTPTQTPEEPWFIFITGAIAICAMILPGISGSFILLIMGKYEFIIRSLQEVNIPIILTFITGAVFGLLSFSRLISWLLKTYHNLTIGLLSGFMLGSLYKIWPWKKTVSTYVDRHGEIKILETENIWPTQYLELGQDPQVLEALAFMVLGILLVVVIEKIGRYYSAKN